MFLSFYCLGKILDAGSASVLKSDIAHTQSNLIGSEGDACLVLFKSKKCVIDLTFIFNCYWNIQSIYYLLLSSLTSGKRLSFYGLFTVLRSRLKTRVMVLLYFPNQTQTCYPAMVALYFLVGRCPFFPCWLSLFICRSFI